MPKSSQNLPPTAAELAVLQLLWQHGALSVKQVHESLESDKPVVYTTVLKTMQVMYERGLLTRVAEGRKHIYTAAIAQEATQDTLLDTFLDKTFSGSAKTMVMRALGKHTPSPSEISELKAFLASLENSQNPQ